MASPFTTYSDKQTEHFMSFYSKLSEKTLLCLIFPEVHVTCNFMVFHLYNIYIFFL